MKQIFTNAAPTPGAYSQAVLVDPMTHVLLFLAGQTGNDNSREGEPVVEGGVGPQTTQTLKNMLAIVKEAGGNITSFVSMMVFLKNCEDLKKSRIEFNEAYKAFLVSNRLCEEGGHLPVRAQVWVSEVPWEFPTEDTVVEIMGVAAIPRSSLNLREKPWYPN